MIEIRVTGETKELAIQLAYLADKFGGTAIVKEAVAHHAAGKVIEMAKKEPIAPVPDQASEDLPASAPVEEPSSDGPIATVEQIQNLCTTKSGVVGIEKVKEVIATFGVKFSRDLPEDKRNACYEALEALK